MRVRRGTTRGWVALCAAVGVLVTACAPAGTPPAVVDRPDDGEILWWRAVRGPQPGIFDENGGEVVLRGVNLNHLGDYFQTDPSLPTVATLDGSDWAAISAQGANVVRLVTSWSAWEPTRGALDALYLDRVRAAVAAAAAHGIHVVVDMHQDAWSRFVFTPAAQTCPPGTHHQIGWDGAPAWATFTDDQPTCTPDRREDSPAVRRAWANFYADRDGVRSALAATWGRIAAAFADEPAVAGFDLLNEPGESYDLGATTGGITAFYQQAIAAIRAAESAAGSPGHMVMFEPTVTGLAIPPGDFSTDPNLVFAPHTYAESIGPDIEGLMDAHFALIRLEGALYSAPVWIGEYGFFNSAAGAKMRRFAVLDDTLLAANGAGSTWWQWEQECGDPHDVSGAYPPSDEWIAAQAQTCGRDGGSLPCTDRPYPRAVPGRLGAVTASCTEHLVVRGTTPVAATADLWFPGATEPSVSGDGVLSSAARAVPGGWRLSVRVTGSYRIVAAR